jgi:hypothetical protein
MVAPNRAACKGKLPWGHTQGGVNVDNRYTGSKTTRISARGANTQNTRAIEQQIDENLRLIYRQCLEEGIPDSLRAIVDQLDEDPSNLADRNKVGDPLDRSKR